MIKKDVKVAKNYLKEDEIKELNRIVGMFLDYAEDQARRRKQVFVNDWPERLDAFLSFNDRDVLPGLGTVSRDLAEQRALAAYEQFNERRRLAAEDQGAVDAMAALEDVARLADQPAQAGRNNHELPPLPGLQAYYRFRSEASVSS
ncbi:MAG: RhuM family protein, partial [Cyanobium sp.]